MPIKKKKSTTRSKKATVKKTAKKAKKKKVLKKAQPKKKTVKKKAVKKTAKKTAAKKTKKKKAVKKTVRKTVPAKKRTATRKTPKPEYSVGQKVVYPMHGVGVIERIEKRTFQDKKEKFYVIRLLSGGMSVMIPTRNAKIVKLRKVVSVSMINKAMQQLKAKKTRMDRDWKTRYQINLDKIKTGSILEVSEVAKNLHKRNKERELSIMEKKLYEIACQLIITEIAIVKNIDREEAERLVFDILN